MIGTKASTRGVQMASLAAAVGPQMQHLKAETKPSKPAKRKWDDDVDSPEEFEQKLNKAEARIKEAEERRAYFNEEFKKTGRQLYRNMAASETEEINKIRNVLSEGYLKLDKMKKSRSAATKA